MAAPTRVPKIAFFLPHFGHGGAEGVVLRLLEGIDRKRFQPILILQHRRGELLAKLPPDGEVAILAPARPPRCIPALARSCAAREVALIVTVTNATNLYALAAAALQGARRMATLVTEHTPVSAFLAEAKLAVPRRAAIRALYPRADLAGGPMDEIGADLSALLGRRAPPFRTLPNPVVDAVGALRPPEPRGSHVVSVGRLAPEKRFDLLIDAFALLHEQRPDARLTIHGDGAERAALTAQAAKLRLGSVVSLPGYSADLDSIHGHADVFACTSRREGLGNAIIEAMARGVPIVSVDCPFGPPRLLRDGAAGTLVRTHDAAHFATALGRTLDDRDLRLRHAVVGLDVARGYSIDAAVDAYQDAFDSAIGAAAARASQ